MRSSASKISGVNTYRPITASVDGASSGVGFSTIDCTRTRSSSTSSGSTQPYDEISSRRHVLQREHRAAVAVVDVEHRAEQLRVVDHDVVAEHHRERLVADVLTRDDTAWPRPSGSFWRM